MNLSGTLSDWTVSDLLNVMRVTGKTASLHIKGARTGTVHFKEGRVVGAVLDGKTVPDGEFESRTVASDTLFVLGALRDGVFEVGPFEGTEAEGWEVETLLADIEALDGLETDLADAGLRDSYLMLRDEIDSPVTVQVEDWWALASLVSVLSFGQLEEVFGRGRAIRLLHTLWRMGVIEKVEDPVEEPVIGDLPPVEPDTPVDLSSLSEEPTPYDEQPDDDAWLDEIAASAAEPEPSDPADDASRLSDVERNVRGVAAPASTVLTGSVLDEMRRLRVRQSD